MVVLEQSAGRKLFLTKEGAVVLDKAGTVVTAYTAKEFDKKILDVLERAAAKYPEAWGRDDDPATKRQAEFTVSRG